MVAPLTEMRLSRRARRLGSQVLVMPLTHPSEYVKKPVRYAGLSPGKFEPGKQAWSHPRRNQGLSRRTSEPNRWGSSGGARKQLSRWSRAGMLLRNQTLWNSPSPSSCVQRCPFQVLPSLVPFRNEARRDWKERTVHVLSLSRLSPDSALAGSLVTPPNPKLKGAWKMVSLAGWLC